MAKVIERLEQKQCELAQPKEKSYLLNDGAGLYLTIQPNGKKLFNLVFGYGGKRISKALGELGKITLKEARELAKIKRAEIESVPKDTTAHNLKITFKAVFKEWIATKIDHTAADTLSRWEYYNKAYFVDFENKKMRDISTGDIMRALDDYLKEQKKESFKKALGVLKAVFNHAILYNYCEINQASKIAIKPLFTKIKTKHISYFSELGQVKELKERILASRATPPLKRLAIFLLYNVTRPSEARLAQWCEIDLEKGIWTIPAHKMKMREAHTIQLSRQIREMLGRVSVHAHKKTDYIFKSLKGGVFSENAINAMLKRLGYSGDIFTAHGVRATFTTILNDRQDEHGLSDNIIQACLAHKIGDSVARSYNHANFERLKAKLYQYWADLLGDIG